MMDINTENKCKLTILNLEKGDSSSRFSKRRQTLMNAVGLSHQ
ncbi:MAG TPA: hypothetical protein O0W81_03015 [Methanocorpusculum sp.]|nr:hypothetical protein [Methanocorpusculum sp.]HJK00725.1 hypothetical protein [Methanocorpusculum sp.]HJK01677.1 hypothetical protein [Methanocorpusculum sp.]